jgi:hypothetical protein
VNNDIADIFPPNQKGERRIYWLQLGAKLITDVQVSNEQTFFKKRTKNTEIEELDKVLILIRTKLQILTPKELLVPVKKLEKWMNKTSK